MKIIILLTLFLCLASIEGYSKEVDHSIKDFWKILVFSKRKQLGQSNLKLSKIYAPDTMKALNYKYFNVWENKVNSEDKPSEKTSLDVWKNKWGGKDKPSEISFSDVWKTKHIRKDKHSEKPSLNVWKTKQSRKDKTSETPSLDIWKIKQSRKDKPSVKPSLDIWKTKQSRKDKPSEKPSLDVWKIKQSKRDKPSVKPSLDVWKTKHSRKNKPSEKPSLDVWKIKQSRKDKTSVKPSLDVWKTKQSRKDKPSEKPSLDVWKTKQSRKDKPSEKPSLDVWKTKQSRKDKPSVKPSLDVWKNIKGGIMKQSNHPELGFQKIIGGSLAEYGEFPFMLQLEYLHYFMCGASAIGDYWVLTAAHCVFHFNHTNIRIRAGSIEKGKNGTLHGVEEIMVHPNYQMFDYDGGDLDEDIAIIKLKDPLSTNPYVKYVELPFQGEPVVMGSISEVVGWGLTKTMFEGEATFLQKAKAEIVNVEDCEENPMLTGRFVVSDNMICAMGEQQTGYKGDSGGPLFTKEGDKVKQIGIASWADLFGNQAFPTIYTKVSQYRLWIFLKTNI